MTDHYHQFRQFTRQTESVIVCMVCGITANELMEQIRARCDCGTKTNVHRTRCAIWPAEAQHDPIAITPTGNPPTDPGRQNTTQ